MDLQLLRSYQQASREQALEESVQRHPHYDPALLTLREIDEDAISQYEAWLTPYDFGWDRVLVWKSKPAHYNAIDVAIWYNGCLAGMCWATPKDSKEKIFVLYIERNPDSSLLPRGYIGPLCLSVVRNYGLLLDLKYVVIDDPIPEARAAYQRVGFRQHQGIGLAYDLTQVYGDTHDEESKNDA